VSNETPETTTTTQAIDPLAITDLSPRRIRSMELPQDPDTLQEMVRQLLQDLAARERSNESLRFQLERMKRALYGPRSEKVSDAQLKLDLAALGLPVDDEEDDSTESREDEDARDNGDSDEAPSPKKRSQRGAHGRRKLPEHLPREVVVHRPDDANCPCDVCDSPKRKIGEEISEVLEYRPANWVVLEHHREKVACPKGCGGVSVAPPAPKPVDKGLCGFGLLAFILTSKYADHIPLNRQVGMIARQGVVLRTSTLSDWVAQGAELLKPIVDVMTKELLKAPVLHTDETGIPVRFPDQEHCHRGSLWVYQSLDRPGVYGHSVFVYTKTKHGKGPQAVLEGYKGRIVADAFSGFNELFGEGKATEGGCWAHSRRKFYDARSFARAEATEALALIKKLYKIEKKARKQKLDPDQILEVRQLYSAPIVEEFRCFLERNRPLFPPSSPLGGAITYATNQWAALGLFCDDGLVPLDNNPAERSLRGPVVGRKNWMFAGSEEGAKRAAILNSIVVSCRLNGVDPWAYLNDVLRRVQDHPAKLVGELTPKAWALARKNAPSSGSDPPS